MTVTNLTFRVKRHWQLSLFLPEALFYYAFCEVALVSGPICPDSHLLYTGTLIKVTLL